MTNKMNIKLGKNQQLIDLNGDLTNFDLNFHVKSLDNKNFYAIVVDQTTLDNNTNLEFRQTENGQIGGNIVYDKNVYQNYFLCLKCDEETNVEIIIQKKEIPPKPEIPQSIVNTNNIKEQYLEKKPSFMNWKIILIIAIVAVSLLLLWIFRKKSNDKNVVNENMIEGEGIISSPVSEKSQVTTFSSSNSSEASSVSNFDSKSPLLNQNIMNKLNKLKC